MNRYNSIQEAILAIQSLDHEELPNEDLKKAFIKNRSLPVLTEMVVKIAELIYSRRAEVPLDFLEVARGTVGLCVVNGWGGLLVDSRGLGILLAIMEELGLPEPIGGYPEEYPDILNEFKDLSEPAMFNPAPEPVIEEEISED